jgi:tRNA (pseudouridine54-N1)-methyltransferase
MRRFVVIGRTATASPEFSLLDTPGTSGRLDVLLRCVRAALLVSHGLRRNVVVYLVLLGGPLAPRALRVDGRAAKFVRPDERSLAVLVKKSLAAAPPGEPRFVEVRPGIAVASGALAAVRQDLAPGPLVVLDAAGADVRGAPLDPHDVVVFLGDHLGLDDETRATLAAWGARPLSLGPLGVHADDAIAIVSNELDRRAEVIP